MYRYVPGMWGYWCPFRVLLHLLDLLFPLMERQFFLALFIGKDACRYLYNICINIIT
jgi:hypothetical protein